VALDASAVWIADFTWALAIHGSKDLTWVITREWALSINVTKTNSLTREWALARGHYGITYMYTYK
jgi:hypothetical protein